MAVKNHALDPLITQAARAEFLEHGFQKASLHKIADRAGLTTGALYTRYRNKEALFRSLVEPTLEQMRQKAQPIEELYLEAEKNPTVQSFLNALRQEEAMYLDLLFDHYEDCILFFCKSGGSILEKQLSQMMERKSAETLVFFRSISGKNLDYDGIELIMSQQFYYYRQILERGYSREKALSCMKTMELFLEAGWKALFERSM